MKAMFNDFIKKSIGETRLNVLYKRNIYKILQMMKMQFALSESLSHCRNNHLSPISQLRNREKSSRCHRPLPPHGD